MTYDSGESLYRSTADVIVFVNRNPNQPTFTEVPYRITLDQNAPYDFLVANTSASDADKVCILLYIKVGIKERQFYIHVCR